MNGHIKSILGSTCLFMFCIADSSCQQQTRKLDDATMEAIIEASCVIRNTSSDLLFGSDTFTKLT